MILFFANSKTIFAVDVPQMLQSQQIEKLEWLFDAKYGNQKSINEKFIGPRPELITPWSSNAVEIAQNIGVGGVRRIEEFYRENESEKKAYNPMLQSKFEQIGQDVFDIDAKPEPIREITDIQKYNEQAALAMSEDEVEYLEEVARKMGRNLTDSEVFGFSQVNSEHCRHKIFNGKFILDGKQMPESLFDMIKKTTRTNPNQVLSAYKDNCAFLSGPPAEQFAPKKQDRADYFETSDFEGVITIKAETHNFPTTVEPINGASTGVGGEIRDRIAGGRGAFPLAGAAVTMTSYPRLDGTREWEEGMQERDWLYNSPEQILLKSSEGAADCGNKFGQPLICGSVFTFEHEEGGRKYGYDKVIMQAGGVGYSKKENSIKKVPKKGDKLVMMGGDNYRIGVGGGANSSVDMGEFSSEVELNAVQRSNPEIQRRVYNAIRALSEDANNPIISIHDHGAGGHLNCFSELVEKTGGRIDIEKLPVGDPSLSALEIIGNESQERMGLIVEEKDIEYLKNVSQREHAPVYVVGDVTDDMKITFVDNRTGEKPMDWKLEYMLGKAPQTVMEDRTTKFEFADLKYDKSNVVKYIEQVLQLEGVACKDWAVSGADRSVGGRVAMQQTAGEIQLPLNNVGVVTFDFHGRSGIATALGHAPLAAMIDPAKGSELAIVESLTNIIFAPLTHGLKGVSLSANWMWPCRNEGEDVRLYTAVKAASDFAIALGVNIPTGKDSLSMTQQYPNGDAVMSPGTVVITSAAEVNDVKKCVSPALKHGRSQIVYVDFSEGEFNLGGSSFGQIVGAIGQKTPTVDDPKYFAASFEAVQGLINDGEVMAGHDVSGGGLITALLEMTFADNRSGMSVDLDPLGEKEMIRVLFSERPALLLQVENGAAVVEKLARKGVKAFTIAEVNQNRRFVINNNCVEFELIIDQMRDTWYKTSYLLDSRSRGVKKATERYNNYGKTPITYKFPEGFTGEFAQYGIDPNRKQRTGIKAAVIREKGSQSEREMAWMMYLAGIDVKDVHMSDLINGQETLEDVNLIAFVGGSSYSDVFGSAKGWAASFLYNERAKQALDNFYARPDTLSIGVCNGCQLMIRLNLITPTHEDTPKMLHNESGKFESVFASVDILKSPSIMLNSLEGSRLGAWMAHGEGKYSLPYQEDRYNIALKYGYEQYPANPNGSDYNAAAIVSDCGRHLAMMPHMERSIAPWNWAYYPQERKDDQTSPWIEMFVNAARWIKERK